MIGITNYSVYVPRRRIRRDAIAAAWGATVGTPTAPGCKAVVNFDEDSLTMAQSAAWPLVDKLNGITPPKRIDLPARVVHKADLDNPDVHQLLYPGVK